MSVTSRDTRHRPYSVSVLTNFFESGGDFRCLLKGSVNNRGCCSWSTLTKQDEVTKLKEEHLVAERRKLFQNSNQLPINLKSSKSSETLAITRNRNTTRSMSPIKKEEQKQEQYKHHSHNNIDETRESVRDSIIKYINGDVSSDDDTEDDTVESMSEGEIKECEFMMKDLTKSWSRINLYVHNISDEDEDEDDDNDDNDSNEDSNKNSCNESNDDTNEDSNEENNDHISEEVNEDTKENFKEDIKESIEIKGDIKINTNEDINDIEANQEISNCVREIQNDFNDLIDSTERLEERGKREINLRRSGNFIKSKRSSSRRKKMKRIPDDVVYQYNNAKNENSSSNEGNSPPVSNEPDNSDDIVLNYCSCSEINDDFFGKMLDPIDFIVETYNNQEENVLYKLTLKREPILMPSLVTEIDKNENRYSLGSSSSNSLSNDSISEDVEIMVKITSHDDDNVSNFESEEENFNRNDYESHVYENFSVRNGSLNEKIQHEYENWTVCDKDNNQRITITHESNLNLNSAQIPGERSPQTSPLSKSYHIIDELQQTELKYINGLEYVIHQYLKHFKNHPNVKQLGMGISRIFGNIEDIFKANQEFYTKLLECEYNVEKIAQLFLDSEHIFSLCSDYMRNKYKTQNIYEQYIGPLLERQTQLNDKKTCDSYLLTPVQRTTRYKLLLESLLKDLKKHREETTLLEKAIAFIDENISEANRLLAIDSIRNCPIDLTNKGPLLLRDTFNIKRKYRSLIFLFRDVIVFTVESKSKQDIIEYKDSILSLDLSLKHQTNSNTFTLINFPKSKTDDNAKFEIEAVNEKICSQWVNEIRDILWIQLHSYKNLRKMKSPTPLYLSDKNENKEIQKKSPDFERNSMRRSTFYVQREEGINN